MIKLEEIQYDIRTFRHGQLLSAKLTVSVDRTLPYEQVLLAKDENALGPLIAWTKEDMFRQIWDIIYGDLTEQMQDLFNVVNMLVRSCPDQAIGVDVMRAIQRIEAKLLK